MNVQAPLFSKQQLAAGGSSLAASGSRLMRPLSHGSTGKLTASSDYGKHKDMRYDAFCSCFAGLSSVNFL
jgi:hypothetical protein